jgi:hypothetical protein
MQKWANLFGLFPFLKSGPVQTRPGALGAGPAGESEAHHAFNGTRFSRNGTRKLAIGTRN